MEENIIKILLANDQSLLRTAIKQGIEGKTPNIKVIAEAENFEQLLNTLSGSTTFDILMMDDIMPGGDAMETLLIIKEKWSEMKIIVTGMYSATDPRFKPLMPFIDGLLSFGSGAEDFRKVVETVSKGGVHFYITGIDKK